MIRIVALLGAALALSIGAATTALGQGTSTPTLKGTVGPALTITLTKGGKKLTTLKPGTYRVSVNDKSSAHNFTLERETKPKIEKHVTSTAFIGTKSMTVNLKKGHWKFYCSVHEALMHGTFTVK